MFRANKRDVLAMGPVFRATEESTRFQRTFLLQRPGEGGEAVQYVIVTRQVDNESPKENDRRRSSRITTGDFTHAVRIYCDLILEQAWLDDLWHEQRAGV